MYLFDTMIISYLLRGDPLAALYRAELDSNGPMSISCQTVGEILYGAAQKRWGASKRAKVDRLMLRFTVLPIDMATAAIYGEIRAGADKLGRPLESQDAWIMATAKQRGLTLVTHDGDMQVGAQVGVDITSRIPDISR